jgi:uncharacterized protein YjiS (DUF1127 family)
MIKVQTRHAPTLPFPTLPANPVRTLSGLAALPALWHQRHHTRRDLARMDRHLLADIGLSETQARAEVAKPFWRE